MAARLTARVAAIQISREPPITREGAIAVRKSACGVAAVLMSLC